MSVVEGGRERWKRRGEEVGEEEEEEEDEEGRRGCWWRMGRERRG